MLKGALTVLCDLLPPFNSEELEKQELFCRNFLCSPGELKCVNKDSMFSRVHNVQNRKTRSGTAVHFNISLLRIPCFCWFDHAEANSIWYSNIFCLRYCFLWFNIFFKRQLHALEKTPVWNFQNFHQKHLAGWESAFYFESCSAGSKTVTYVLVSEIGLFHQQHCVPDVQDSKVFIHVHITSGVWNTFYYSLLKFAFEQLPMAQGIQTYVQCYIRCKAEL